jgi:hypothetical protein
MATLKKSELGASAKLSCLEVTLSDCSKSVSARTMPSYKTLIFLQDIVKMTNKRCVSTIPDGCFKQC